MASRRRPTHAVPSFALVVVLAATSLARGQDEGSTRYPELPRLQVDTKLDLSPYKHGDIWPLRNFEGIDFMESIVPLAAARQGDLGRLALNTALPVGLLAGSLTLQGTDSRTLGEVGRWGWVGVDHQQENYPTLFALMGLSAASIFLPSKDVADSEVWSLRLDRATVLALGLSTATITTELLKQGLGRLRPSGKDTFSRPSGHATWAFGSAAFLANVLRDTLRPQDEKNLWRRMIKEIVSALPYAAATYVSLGRVRGKDHYLTDVMLGAAVGSLSMHFFYAWSFTKRETGESWLPEVSIGWNGERQGIEFGFKWDW